MGKRFKLIILLLAIMPVAFMATACTRTDSRPQVLQDFYQRVQTANNFRFTVTEIYNGQSTLIEEVRRSGNLAYIRSPFEINNVTGTYQRWIRFIPEEERIRFLNRDTGRYTPWITRNEYNATAQDFVTAIWDGSDVLNTFADVKSRLGNTARITRFSDSASAVEVTIRVSEPGIDYFVFEIYLVDQTLNPSPCARIALGL